MSGARNKKGIYKRANSGRIVVTVIPIKNEQVGAQFQPRVVLSTHTSGPIKRRMCRSEQDNPCPALATHEDIAHDMNTGTPCAPPCRLISRVRTSQRVLPTPARSRLTSGKLFKANGTLFA